MKHNFINFKKNSAPPIIDLREANDFCNAHWLNSSSFPVENILSRQHELPSNNQPLRLIGNPGQLLVGCEKLIEKGYVIENTLEWNEKLQQQLVAENLISTGNYSPRLWSPARILEHFQEKIIINKQLGKALDIGSGAGRDSVYLATHGWQVTAIDYSVSALEKATLLANHAQVKINCIQMDLEKDLEIFAAINEIYQLIIVSRYLHRPLLPVLKNKIAVGGHLVYQTFMTGCEIFGSPRNPRFLLKEGELASVFHDFEIILDEVHYLDDGRPTNRFIAKRLT